MCKKSRKTTNNISVTDTNKSTANESRNREEQMKKVARVLNPISEHYFAASKLVTIELNFISI